MSRSVQAPWAWSAARWMVGALAVAAAVQALLCALGREGLGAAHAAEAPVAVPSSDPLRAAAPQSPRAAQSVLLGVSRAGDRLVAVGERGVILTSDDSGQHWQQAQVPVSVTLTAVHFATPQLGWAVGHSGVVLHSSDGGRHWSRQLDGQGAAQAELQAARAAAQARDDDASKRRLRDAERALDEGANQPWLDVRFGSPSEGVVVGAYGAILRTRDGGRSWQSLRGHLANPKGRHLYGIQLGVAGKLYVVGEQGSLFVSHDRGDHFDTLTTPYRGTFFGLQAQGGQLLAYGLRGNVWRSADEGQSWEAVSTGQATTVTAGTTRPNGQVVLVDESGRALQTVPGAHGLGLTPVRVPQAFAFTGVVTAADGSLVLTGVRGTTRIPPETPLASAQP